MFKDIYRSFNRSPLFSILNVLGLSIGLAVALLAMLFTYNELSYDKHFPDADRIVSLNIVEINQQKEVYAICTRDAITQVVPQVPGIEVAVQATPNRVRLMYGEENYVLSAIETEPDFLEMFSIKVLAGSADQFNTLNTAMLGRNAADVIFGGIENAVGKVVRIGGVDINIVGVVENVPKNTHFSFAILLNTGILDAYGGMEYITFYKIAKEASFHDVRKHIEDVYTKGLQAFQAEYEWEGECYAITEELSDIYLNSQVSYGNLGKKSSIWTLVGTWLVSGLILLLAIINFVTLYVAQSGNRISEIGIRKGIGASAKDITKMVVSEIGASLLLAMGIGFLLAVWAAPYAQGYLNTTFSFEHLSIPVLVISMIVLFIVITFITALYPTMYLNRFTPLSIIYKRVTLSKQRLTSILVICQAVITIVFLSSIFLVMKQASYIRTIPSGYNPENVIAINLNSNMSKERYLTVKEQLLNINQVEEVGSGDHVVGYGTSGEQLDSKSVNTYRLAPEIPSMIGIELREGRFLSDAPRANREMLLTEKTVEVLGLEYPVVGSTLPLSGTPYEVVGVLKNFAYAGPSYAIDPMVVHWYYEDDVRFIYLKYKGEYTKDLYSEISTVLKQAGQEFVPSPIFLQEIYEAGYSALDFHLKIAKMVFVLSIVISMMGLFALHAYNTRRRRREVAIRRVHGASRVDVMKELSTDIVKWIVIAGVVSVPIVYFLAQKWLEYQAFKTPLSIWIFILPVLIQLVIALIITSGVTMNALKQNPIESLKSE